MRCSRLMRSKRVRTRGGLRCGSSRAGSDSARHSAPCNGRARPALRTFLLGDPQLKTVPDAARVKRAAQEHDVPCPAKQDSLYSGECSTGSPWSQRPRSPATRSDAVLLFLRRRNDRLRVVATCWPKSFLWVLGSRGAKYELGKRASLHVRHTKYAEWLRMKSRCYYPRNRAFKRYGGSGVKVCERWRESFSAFLEDVGPKPSEFDRIVRVDERGDFGPDNCVWELNRDRQRRALASESKH
jgi:hypothetical protein